MPLDGHAHLVSQGWEGKGSGLRNGAINRPVVIAQKKTLSGVGKDRDEAFPFWDHVFSAAASSIKIKIYDSDSEETDSPTSAVTFQRTKTGIISNRRPTHGTPASGTATPSDPSSSSSSGSSTPRMSVMATARQEAARRMLYSMFFRGPILGMDVVEEMAKVELVEGVEPIEAVAIPASEASDGPKEKKRKRSSKARDEDLAPVKKRKSKTKDSRTGKEVVIPSEEADDGERVPSDKSYAGAETEQKCRKEEKRRRKAVRAESVPTKLDRKSDAETIKKAERKRLKAEKRTRKEERRRLKEENRAANDVLAEPQIPPNNVEEARQEGTGPSAEDIIVRKKKKRKVDSSS